LVEEVERRLIITPVLLRVPATEWLAQAVVPLAWADPAATAVFGGWAHRDKETVEDHGRARMLGSLAGAAERAVKVVLRAAVWGRPLIFLDRIFSSAVAVVERVTPGAEEMVGTAVAVVERTAALLGVTD
jgi:hypothetical protein